MAQPHVQPLPHRLQSVVERFVDACRADARVEAAFLGGSFAAGAADEHSDLDLGVITSDADYDAFLVDAAAFIRQLGEPLFVESFDLPHNVFYMLADGTEGELAIGRAGDFASMQRGPICVLLDPRGLLADADFTGAAPDDAERAERVRRLLVYFWHDLSHCVTALGRGQVWWAHGQLEELRGICVNLARLRHDPADDEEDYWKLDQLVPAAALEPLRATCPPLELDAVRAAVWELVRYYQSAAPELARAHGLAYPRELERLLLARLRALGDPDAG
jgi:predicted nucleotidyltransferase